MVRRSTKMSTQEEFAVAVATGDFGFAQRDAFEAERRGKAFEVRADAGVHLRVAHDAFLVLCGRHLELRLFQRASGRRPPRGRGTRAGPGGRTGLERKKPP